MKMISRSLPDLPQATDFIAAQQQLPFTYTALGLSVRHEKPAGFDLDYQRAIIGQGEQDFEAAKAAVRQWRMFPEPWTRILPPDAPIAEGATVAMFARFLGLWWRNACRIVYVIDEPKRFGFAYGTLPGHVESGEELFLVEIDEKGAVWYTIRAFSRPRFWAARLGYPIMRRLQARFRRDSARQMRVS